MLTRPQDGAVSKARPAIANTVSTLEVIPSGAALAAEVRGIDLSLPAPEEMSGRNEADKAFDKLVKSRFPMLATKEGELVRLQAGVARLVDEPGEACWSAWPVPLGSRCSATPMVPAP